MNTEKDPLVFFTFLGVIGITALIWYLSIKIGADFGTTLKAVTLSLVALGISGTIYYITRILSWAHFTGTLALLWPCWWPVIDSAANNGMAPENITFRFPNEIWWNTELFFYGTEGALVAITIFLVYLNRQEGYAY
jgi:hypothetical protein